MKPKTYIVHTISDLISLPPERLQACLAELPELLANMKAERDRVLKAMPPHYVKRNQRKLTPSVMYPFIEWTDDGIQSSRLVGKHESEQELAMQLTP